MSYIDQFKEECKPLVFALEHGDEILDIVTWEVYWHGENKDGSDLTLDLNTVEECLDFYIENVDGRENIAECLGLNERKSQLILQDIEADDYSKTSETSEMSTVKPLKSMIPYVKRSACFAT